MKLARFGFIPSPEDIGHENIHETAGGIKTYQDTPVLSARG
jgi:hypothetical protein